MSTGQETGHYVQNENQKFSGHPQSLNFSKKGSSSHQSFGKKYQLKKPSQFKTWIPVLKTFLLYSCHLIEYMIWAN